MVRALHGGDLDDAAVLVGDEPEWSPALEAFRRLYGESDDTPRTESTDADARAQIALAEARLATITLGAIAPYSTPPDDAWGFAATQLRAWLAMEKPEAPTDLASEPALRVEQMCLRALVALSEGDEDVATRHARQATRAAYAEALRGQELFAYWVLGRVRRCSGNIYAAARILGALARAAPVSWRPLVDWELVLAGGDESSVDRALTEPAATWVRLCAAAEGKGRAAWDRELAALQALELAPRFAGERDALLAGLTPQGAVDLEAQRAVAGALYESAERLGRTPAVWRVDPGHPPRLQWCVVAPDPDAAILFDEGERVRTLAAALAHAGEAGIDVESAFAAVYGFAFDPSVHDGIFRVLLHRARGALEGRGEVARDGDRLKLVPASAMLLPEPRSEPPFGDRILRLIATSPGRTAKELAERSGTSVRGVQRALRLLIETGACRSEREGRRTTYHVEDTTFREPTHFQREQTS